MGEDRLRWELILEEGWLARAVAGAEGRGYGPAVAELLEVLDDLIRHLREGRAEAVEAAIAFLAADTVFFRSGYATLRLCRAIPRAPLTEDQEAWFRSYVLRRCRERVRLYDMRGVRRLARAVATPDLVRQLRAIPPSADPDRRAAEHRFITSVAEGARSRAV